MDISLDRNLILEVFASLSECNGATASPFCDSAKLSTERMLRDDCDIYNNMCALCYAAGCMAFYRYTVKTAIEDTPSFKAGDLSITQSTEKNITFARMLLCDALDDVRDLLKAKRFAFRRA
ncbi:MAG: hypothetical protein RR177_01240, partial [Oscillospiraceae bacterium]